MFFEELCIEIYVFFLNFGIHDFFHPKISNFRSLLRLHQNHPTKGASQIPLANFGSARPAGAA